MTTEHGPLILVVDDYQDAREMYATFNMGAGFAAYVSEGDAQRCVKLAEESGYTAWVGGTVLRESSRKVVQIVPLGIEFDAQTLQVR